MWTNGGSGEADWETDVTTEEAEKRIGKRMWTTEETEKRIGKRM